MCCRAFAALAVSVLICLLTQQLSDVVEFPKQSLGFEAKTEGLCLGLGS